MTRQLLVVAIGALCVLLLLTGVALAMDSTNYQLEWFTPLTGSGGAAASTNYAANITMGQSAITMNPVASTNYNTCIGYWCGARVSYSVYLPLILRN